MNDDKVSSSNKLPIKRSITIAYVISIIIASILVFSFIIIQIYQDDIYKTDVLKLAFVPTDWVNIIIGVVLIIVSLLLCWRNKLIGLLFLPATLFFMVYSYFIYLIGMPFTILFLPYLIIVILSIYTTIFVVSTIDLELIKQKLEKYAPARISAGIIIALFLFIVGRQIAIIVTSLINKTNADVLTLALWIDDLLIMCPVMIIGGILLWRKKALGYIAGFGILLAYGLLSLGLVPVLTFKANYNSVPVGIVDIIVVVVMGLICLVPLIFFIRGAISKK